MRGCTARVRRTAALAHELAYECDAAALLEVCGALRDAPELKFEMLMDLAGVDYLHYGRDDWQTESATRSGFSRARRGAQQCPGPGRDGPLRASSTTCCPSRTTSACAWW